MELLKLNVKLANDYKKKLLIAFKNKNDVDVIYFGRKYTEAIDEIKNILNRIESVEQILNSKKNKDNKDNKENM